MIVTKRRYDEHSTEFGLWLRNQREIDSGIGYVPTNVDYVWRTWKTNQWLYLEEKRHLAECQPFQLYTFRILHNLALADPLYYGFHFIAFENTSPMDGEMYLDFNQIDIAQLIAFFSLLFRNVDIFLTVCFLMVFRLDGPCLSSTRSRFLIFIRLKATHLLFGVVRAA